MPTPPAVGQASQGSKKKRSDSKEDYFEPDEEELEEERQDAAARQIQGLFRAKRARYTLRELIKANYVKEIDSLTGESIYRNRSTGHTSRCKPMFLGDDDLETPRYFAASDGYDPGKSAIPQFALIITNNVFESPKIPNIPEQVLADHEALRETLENPYFSKFQSENCFFVKNATAEVITASLASVQRQVSATMARLKKEAERIAKALRRERDTRALERKNDRRAKKEDGRGASSAGSHSNPSRPEAGGEQDGDEDRGQEGVDTAEEEDEGGEEEEEEEEEEFDPEEGLLLVYVCTHVAVITKGKGFAGTYLVAADTSWKSKEQLANTAVLLESFAAVIERIQVRNKVLFLDVVHTEREDEGFKTRHLYPPHDLYDSAAALCGAVVVGSCRIGGRREVDLDLLREEAADFWSAVESRQHGDGIKNSSRASGSDTDSATSGGSSSGGSGGSGSQSNNSCDSDGTSGGGNENDDDADQESGSGGSDGSSNGSVNKSSGTGDNRSAGSSTHRGVSQREIRSGGDSSDGDAGNTPDRKGEKQGKKIRGEEETSKRGKGTPQSLRNLANATSRGGKNVLTDIAWKNPLASGGSSIVKGQQYGMSGTRACAAVYDRAIYEESMSVFGRAVRDALKGKCVENVNLSRVLVVDLYNFIQREFAPFEQPRKSIAQEEADAARERTAGSGGGGNREAVGKTGAAAENKAKKRAGMAEDTRRARLGPRAAAEEVRKAKEAEKLREVEEEKRRRTQLPVLAGLSISAIARATACASPSPPPRPMVPFALEITRTAVRLAWLDPPFPGEPPLSYKLESRGDLRGNSTWAPVFPPWYPPISSQPVNIYRRVPGLGLRYRVRACNHGGWGEASDPTELVTTKAWLENMRRNSAARAMEALARTGGARLVLARMRRYSASLLVQESGFHQLVAEFNKGPGIPRASLAQEVLVAVADAMAVFSQVRGIQASGLLLIGWAARGKADAVSDFLPADLVERCLDLVATAETLHWMDDAITNHAGWAKFHLRRGEKRCGAGAAVEHRTAIGEDDVWAGTSSFGE